MRQLDCDLIQGYQAGSPTIRRDIAQFLDGAGCPDGTTDWSKPADADI
jgi:hypothetical protein